MFSVAVFAGESGTIGTNAKMYIGKWMLNNGTYTVKVSPKDDINKNIISIQFDAKKYAGKSVYFECEVKGENVSNPIHIWNGVKFMLVFRYDDGTTSHPATVARKIVDCTK